MHKTDESPRWLDRPGNVTRVYVAVWVACGLLLLAELLVHKHADVPAEAWFGFHGWFGFVGCVALVLAAKALRRVLMRPEDYYDR